MRALLQNRSFRLLWCSQIGLAIGDAVMQMGLLELFRVHHYDKQVETAKMFFAAALPGALLGPFAIAYLDRWQRRNVLMIGDALRAVMVLIIAAWLAPLLLGRMEERHLFVVYLLIFGMGAITTFYYPARYALVPNLVEADQLIKANTLFATTLAVATVGGRALGGFIAEQMGVVWAVTANALAYVLSVAAIWNIQMLPHATKENTSGSGQNGWRELETGLQYIRQHRSALPLVVLAALFAFLLGILAVVFVGYAMDTLGLRTAGVGYLVAAGGAGAALGIVGLGRDRPWTRASWLPFALLMVAALVLLLLSMTTNVWVAVPQVVMLGAVAATVLVYMDARLQEQVEDIRRGAVFAARGLLTSVTMCVAFGLQIWTSVLRRTPPPTVLWWLGIGSMVAAVLTLVTSRGRRRRDATA